MSTVKLTLSIPKNILLKAKDYSSKCRRPLSQLVSDYFTALTSSVEKEDRTLISKRVLSVTGLAKSARKEDDLLFEVLKKKYEL